MIHLTEPASLQTILFYILEYVNNNHFWSIIMPKLADIFVFTYPVFLIILYSVWIYNKNKKIKKIALFILFSVMFATILNILFQLLFNKPRPIYDVANINNWHSLLHAFLPSTSFPSDHAVVSMTIWIITIVLGKLNKMKNIKILWIVFVIFSLIMWLARVSIWLHRITDILWWFMISILCLSIILWFKKIKNTIDKISDILVNIEEKILYFWYKWEY